MVQVKHSTDLGMHRRFTILVATTDTVWASLALIIAITDLIDGKIGPLEQLSEFLLSILCFVIGFGIVLAWGAIKQSPRLLMIWVIPNVICMFILLLLVFAGAFLPYKQNYLFFAIIGFIFVRAAAVLKVYEMYLHVQKKNGGEGSAQLYNETETFKV